MKLRKLDESVFLNVDLEIFSRSDLKSLADALKRDLSISFLGMEFGKHKAYFDLLKQPKTPDEGIIRSCKLIQKLSPRLRKIWDDAESRSFDIGFESPKRARYFWGAVSSEAIRAAAAVEAQIAITIYRPMKVPKQSKRNAKPHPNDFVASNLISISSQR